MVASLGSQYLATLSLNNFSYIQSKAPCHTFRPFPPVQLWVTFEKTPTLTSLQIPGEQLHPPKPLFLMTKQPQFSQFLLIGFVL